VDFQVSERTVRLNIGLEGTETLWSDLMQGLTKAARQ
jgi:cystathionine beta-lyase/cystathionine gamma-synthase